jgi:hypothetical protein
VACAAAFRYRGRTYEADIQGMAHSVANGTQEIVLVDKHNEKIAVLSSYALHPPANAYILEFALAALLGAFAVFCVATWIVIRRRSATPP